MSENIKGFDIWAITLEEYVDEGYTYEGFYLTQGLAQKALWDIRNDRFEELLEYYDRVDEREKIRWQLEKFDDQYDIKKIWVFDE